MVISTQQPVARDLRHLMGIQYIATELERMGDYAVRISRMTGTLVGLPDQPLRAEFGIMGELAIGQVHDILEALIEENEIHAREVAGRDNEIDRLYHRVFEDLVAEMGNGKHRLRRRASHASPCCSSPTTSSASPTASPTSPRTSCFWRPARSSSSDEPRNPQRHRRAGCWSSKTTRESARCSSTTSSLRDSRCRRQATAPRASAPRGPRGPT